jgi:hypothetical protein
VGGSTYDWAYYRAFEISRTGSGGLGVVLPRRLARSRRERSPSIGPCGGPAPLGTSYGELCEGATGGESLVRRAEHRVAVENHSLALPKETRRRLEELAIADTREKPRRGTPR